MDAAVDPLIPAASAASVKLSKHPVASAASMKPVPPRAFGGDAALGSAEMQNDMESVPKNRSSAAAAALKVLWPDI
jgi:hypothetical protein